MTGDVLRIDTVALRTAEPAFDTMAAAVDGILVRLTAALSAEGSCWGGDEAGNAFAHAYLPGARLTCDGLPHLRDGFAGTGVAVLTAADNVDGADGRAEERFA